MKKYTVEEIRTYIESQDSLGDVLYNLSEDSIEKAILKQQEEDEPWSECCGASITDTGLCSECYEHV